MQGEHGVNEDSELLDLLKQGDKQAFTALYNKYKGPLAANMLKLLKNAELTEEVLQDLFMKVWDNREKLNPTLSFRAYVFRIGKNLVYDIFRKAARDKQLESKLVQNLGLFYSHIEEQLISKENREILDEILSELPPQRKKVYILFKIEQKSYKEISETLGISASTINEHIQKANKFITNRFTNSNKEALLLLFWIAFTKN